MPKGNTIIVNYIKYPSFDETFWAWVGPYVKIYKTAAAFFAKQSLLVRDEKEQILIYSLNGSAPGNLQYVHGPTGGRGGGRGESARTDFDR